DAQPGDVLLRQAGDRARSSVAGLEHNLAGARFDLAGDDVQQGRLTSAIGANDHAQLSALHGIVQGVGSFEAVIIDGYVLDAEDLSWNNFRLETHDLWPFRVGGRLDFSCSYRGRLDRRAGRWKGRRRHRWDLGDKGLGALSCCPPAANPIHQRMPAAHDAIG